MELFPAEPDLSSQLSSTNCGSITLEEQLLILELQSRWGNRWSKIAQHLPGRTDNEIKNYWRTRVQKLAKPLKCDVNSKQFKDTMRYIWMPRLVERIQAAAAAAGASSTAASSDSFGEHANSISSSSVKNYSTLHRTSSSDEAESGADRDSDFTDIDAFIRILRR